MKKYILAFCIICAAALLYKNYKQYKARSTQQSQVVTGSEQGSMPDDFYDFYEKFHSDVEFQKAHIVFPLQGAKAKGEEQVLEPYSYTAEEWVIHKPYDDMEGTYQRSFSEFGGIVAETIQAVQGPFSMIRRFAKVDGKWHLIYYQPMSMTGQE